MSYAGPRPVAAVPTTVDSPLVPTPYVMRRIRKETQDTFTLDLEPRDHPGPFRFMPGQFNMLYVFGVGEAAISISGDPGKTETLVHTIREVGTVTRALRQLKPGDEIGIRGPFGAPWPLEAALGKDILLLVGGIGLAPLRPVMYHLLAERTRFGKVVLLFGVRTPQDILYRKEMERWSARLDIDILVTVDLADAGWHGNIGVVTTLIRRAPIDRGETIAMICGPEIMMRYSLLELAAQGVEPEDIYISMERNMKCATGFCGHCQFGPAFICKDGPVFPYIRIRHWFEQREV
jgi:NAD(P)H-flavin reductase